MTRGKYAARAANRLAEIDDGLIAELREKVQVLTQERDDALTQLDQARRGQAAAAQRVGAELAAATVERLTADLSACREQAEADRISYSERVFDLLNEHGAELPIDGWGKLAAIFGRGHEVGTLIGRSGQVLNRHGRRSRQTKVNQLAEVSRMTGEIPR